MSDEQNSPQGPQFDRENAQGTSTAKPDPDVGLPPPKPNLQHSIGEMLWSMARMGHERRGIAVVGVMMFEDGTCADFSHVAAVHPLTALGLYAHGQNALASRAMESSGVEVPRPGPAAVKSHPDGVT